MRTVVLLCAMAVALPTTKAFFSETNSRAATARGIKAFAAGNFDAAANDFAEAERLRPTTWTALNRGTAEVAAGRIDSGVAALSRAAADPAIREQALFNRGTAMLAARNFDRAVADLEETLRLNPSNIRAKRNLEIALQNKQREEGAGGGAQQPSTDPQQQAGSQQQANAGGTPQQPNPAPQGGRPSVEAILESVAQQEREELRRLRQRGRGERRVTTW